MLRFEIKAIIADENKIVRHDTIYLFNKEKKLLLPIKINDSETKNLLLAYDSRMQHRPTIHDTAKRLISALRGQIDKVIINDYSQDIYYAYIRIKHKDKYLDVDSKISDAIALALRSNAPIFVKNRVTRKAGIKLTRELLDASHI